jgi:hypothetical protein
MWPAGMYEAGRPPALLSFGPSGVCLTLPAPRHPPGAGRIEADQRRAWRGSHYILMLRSVHIMPVFARMLILRACRQLLQAHN